MKITELKSQIESNLQFFKDNLQKVNSFADLCKIYDVYINGKTHKIFKEIILQNNLDISHWNWHKKYVKYLKIEKICSVCNNIFITESGGKKERGYCSQKCANSFSRHTQKSREKISKSIRDYLQKIGKSSITTSIYKCGEKITKPNFKINCTICGKEKWTRKKSQKFCSNKCSMEYRRNNPIYRKRLSDGIKLAIKEGRFKGWNIHRIGQGPSYPEKFFMGVLDSRGIKYIYDKPCGKYHIDFALEDSNKKIALEIDGGQHKEKSLKYRDDKKDLYLTNEKWKVYRIPWKSINTEAGKKYIKEEIDKFVSFYNNV